MTPQTGRLSFEGWGQSIVWESAEIRWFYEGDIPSDVQDWLAQVPGIPDQQPVRIDHYLRLAGDDSLGIKLREGRIEIKQRLGRHGIVTFNQRVAGLLQTWRKWSFPLAPVGDPSGSPGPASSWIAVHKERRLHRYALVDQDRLLSAATDHYPLQGCDLELTRLSVARQRWWTLALEAFGPEDTLRDTVLLAGQHLFRYADPPLLEARSSRSYPTWLCTARSE